MWRDEELWSARLTAKQIIWTIFANDEFMPTRPPINETTEERMRANTEWLYLNLFEFQVDYSTRNYSDYSSNRDGVITEQFRVRIEERSSSTNASECVFEFSINFNIFFFDRFSAHQLLFLN